MLRKMVDLLGVDAGVFGVQEECVDDSAGRGDVVGGVFELLWDGLDDGAGVVDVVGGE